MTTERPSGVFTENGAAALSGIDVDAYNAELRDADGFIGDRASNHAFREILEDWRERLRKVGDDPLGEVETEALGKKELDRFLLVGTAEAAGVVHSAVEDFAKELATVTGRFLRLEAWKDTQRIVVGGGFRQSRVGELAIGRASVILKGEGHAIELVPIRHHPDEAGLIGAVHLAPAWVFEDFDAILAVDIGGSKIRGGIVSLGPRKGADLAQAAVHAAELWKHRDEKPGREEAVDRLVAILEGLVGRAAKDGLVLAPFIGVGCPGVIEADGAIARGGQNLPGNWESSRFNLPHCIREEIPKIGDHETMVVMHNDAVVQGLSELPYVRDRKHWGVLTIGTGLGNASFSNRHTE